MKRKFSLSSSINFEQGGQQNPTSLLYSPTSLRTTWQQQVRRLPRLLGLLVLAILSEFLLLVYFRHSLFLFFLPYRHHLPALAWMLLSLLAFMYGTLVIHECGHLLAVLLLRFHFLRFVAGPLKIECVRGRVVFRANLKLNLFEGFVSSLPREIYHLRRHEIIIFASGPLANFAQTALLYAISIVPGLEAHGPYVLFLRLAAAIALLCGLLNLLPFRTYQGELSDGAALLILFRGGLPVTRWYAISSLSMEFFSGQLPRDWDPYQLSQAMVLSDHTPEDLSASAFAYYHALDTRDIPTAVQLLERMLAIRKPLPVSSLRWLAMEAAYLQARFLGDAALARAWFARGKRSGVETCTRCRVEAAILAAEGNHLAASACIRQGLQSAQDTRWLGRERMEMAWLNAILPVDAKPSYEDSATL